MNIINKILLGMAGVASMWMCSCGDGTEELTPSEPYVNFFEVPASDSSESASLRRDFYGDTGIYLLFSDVLAEYTDEFGNDRVEKVDFNWVFTDNRLFDYRFDLLESDEQKNVVDLLSKYFIPYINVDGGQLKPYSILLVKNLESTEGSSSGRYKACNYISGWRCFCINVSDWLEADDDVAKALGQGLLGSLVAEKLSEDSPELDPFFAFSAQYYEEYIYSFFEDWIDFQDMDIVYGAGFMRYFEDWLGEHDYDEFLSRKNDLADFRKALFEMSEEEFMEQWGDYDLIVEKYKILKECISELGIDFNAVK